MTTRTLRAPTLQRAAALSAILVGAAGLALGTLGACSSSGGTASRSSASVSSAAGLRGTAHATVGDLAITGGYVPQPASPAVAAAYFTITNRGSRADTLIKTTTNVTSSVMAMSESSKNGVGSMTDLKSVVVPAHGSVRLTPGHAHLMLEKPARALKQGDRVRMVLTFAHAGTVTLVVPVVALTGPSGQP